MASVVYSPDAKDDLRDIWDYVSIHSPLQADRLINRFREKLALLAEWNTLGRPRPELSKGCRSFPFGRYCFYFRQTEDGIEVLRVLHSARDIEQIRFLE